MMEPIDTIVVHWRERLLLDEWRETYDAMTDEQKKIVRLALRYPSGNEIDELERKYEDIKSKFPWHRGDEGSPDVPVLQKRYDALRTRADQLEQDLAGVRSIFPWHRGDPDGLDVPVLQPRYDALRKHAEELENITSWKQQRMASDTDYLPFVDAHYWYEPERGPVIYAGEANLLERQIVELEARIALLESDMKSGDYETLYAETVRELQDATARITELTKEGTTVWLWKRNLSEVTTRDMTGDPNWIAAEVYYSLNDNLTKDE